MSTTEETPRIEESNSNPLLGTTSGAAPPAPVSLSISGSTGNGSQTVDLQAGGNSRLPPPLTLGFLPSENGGLPHERGALGAPHFNLLNTLPVGNAPSMVDQWGRLVTPYATPPFINVGHSTAYTMRSIPTTFPSAILTTFPSGVPTAFPSAIPTTFPSGVPSAFPSAIPTTFPSATEITNLPSEEASTRINLESILVSIDNFFNRYPFFVATIAFIWLVVIPLTEEYLQKYKYVSAIDAFKKLQDDPNSQLLDIRDRKSVAYLGSPNLKILNKSTVQVDFREDDEDGFVKRVLENFGEPANTTVCILDNFDGNSMKVAELLVKKGFKEAYAIQGGIRGQKGWQEIQETLLPLSVHVYPKKKAKMSKQVDTNGGILVEDRNNNESPSNTSSTANSGSEVIKNEDLSSISPTVQSKAGQRPLSPYPNYPDLKPPSSPTPSKPN
ncbi:hypothetical protein BUALT_Bualt02G0166200 [Buddleja alternifolia]|uniref:Rhodanese domain-containing protein n=1 Tax=Buddleja alternifolia TaxID=168488 RepID=A0AAV6Y7X0_9LAMI|nr:hypothetical protein BUALT_Bualt02G0166200 [Buddleja alternifolia]